MTSLTIQLPDELAEKLQKAGLLESEQLAKLLEWAIQNPLATPICRKPDPRLVNTVEILDDLTKPTSNLKDWELD